MTQSDTTTMTTAAALMWTAILGTAAVFGSYAFACVFPFAALASIAALTLDVRRGAVLVFTIIVVNQTIGFTLRHYPHELSTYLWGVFIALGAFSAFGAALIVRGDARLLSARTPLALAAAVIAYQVVMFVGATALDGFASSTAAIVAKVALNDVEWFLGLGALRLVLERIMPLTFSARPVLTHA